MNDLRFMELVSNWLDGSLSETESAELQAVLEDSADRRSEFVDVCGLDADLRLMSDVVIEMTTGADSMRAPTGAKGMRAVGWLGLVAALAAVLLLAIGYGIGRDRKNDAEQQIASSEVDIEAPGATESYAATVVMDVDALLTKDDLEWKDASLPVGSYHLRNGLLNLRFGNGVLVYIEAPAQFEAINEERVVLHSGRLSANVPPEGIGFTVETPEAEVVDFGTEFSVDVESGASEVHVFDGLVRVHSEATNNGEISKSVDVKASQAVRITDQVATPVEIEIARDRFIRNFDEPKRKYSLSAKQLSPLAYYRMPIRDRGMVSDPPQFSGVVLTGEGIRPPHARGVFTGGSLRVKADSTGRGGWVKSPPQLSTGQFSLAVFVYLEKQMEVGTVATNLQDNAGNFALQLEKNGVLRATIKNSDGDIHSVTGQVALPVTTWRHIVMTADGEQLKLYEDGRIVAATRCGSVAVSDSDPAWFGTGANGNQLWDGRIDELALFDKALTEQEITDLYQIAKEEMVRSK